MFRLNLFYRNFYTFGFVRKNVNVQRFYQSLGLSTIVPDKFENESTKVVSPYSDQKNKWTVSSFELLKLYIMDRKPVTNPDLILHGLMGASRPHTYREFLNIYGSWWRLLKENVKNFNEEQLCEILSYLGYINKFSKGGLRRKLFLDDIKFLLSQIIDGGLNKLTPR